MNDFIKKSEDGIFILTVNLVRATYKEALALKDLLSVDIKLRKNKKIIIDLNLCDYIDSTFLGVLVQSRKMISEIGGEIKMVSPKFPFDALRERMQTFEMFESYDSLETAKLSFK